MDFMEIQLKRISLEANVYHVREAVALVLHGPGLYDPNDKGHKGRKPNFEIVMGKSPAGRHHDGTAILRVATKLGSRLLDWNREAANHNIVVFKRPLRISRAHGKVPPYVKQMLEKALYVEPDQDRLHTQKKDYASQVRLRIAKLQFGVWFKGANDPQAKARAFSIEHERDFLRPSAAYMTLVYERGLIRIDVSATLFDSAHITSIQFRSDSERPKRTISSFTSDSKALESWASAVIMMTGLGPRNPVRISCVGFAYA